MHFVNAMGFSVNNKENAECAITFGLGVAVLHSRNLIVV